MSLQFHPPVAVNFNPSAQATILVSDVRQALDLLAKEWPECSSQEFEDAALSCLEALGGGSVATARSNFEIAARLCGLLVEPVAA